MRLDIISNSYLKKISFRVFIISFICLNLFLVIKFYINLHQSIFEEPTNILFWDDWSITKKNFINSITAKHNEHQLSIPIAISWLSFKLSGLPGGFNLIFSSIFRIISLIFYILTLKNICRISFKEKMSFNSFIIISFSLISGIIFFNYPISYRTLDWGFMLHWYIPLSILFINGYLIFAYKLNLNIFLITYLLVFLSYFSGSQWLICLSSLTILIFLRSINSKKHLIINSLFSFISLTIIDSFAGNSSTVTLSKLLDFNLSFLIGIIWHAFNLSFPFLIILLLIYFVNIYSTGYFKKLLSDPYFQFSAYIFFAGITFSILVTLARGNNIDANIFSPSYPTYTGLIPFSIVTLLISEINKKSIFDIFSKIYFLIISLFFSYALLSKFYFQKLSIIKEERYWQTYSFACRVIGYQFKKAGYEVIFDSSCGSTYPSDQIVFKNMGNPIFEDGFNNLIDNIDISNGGIYQVNEKPIISVLPFIKKIKISEIKDDISSKDSIIKVVHESSSKRSNNFVTIKIIKHKYIN